jgi:hypothetical protein
MATMLDFILDNQLPARSNACLTLDLTGPSARDSRLTLVVGGRGKGSFAGPEIDTVKRISCHTANSFLFSCIKNRRVWMNSTIGGVSKMTTRSNYAIRNARPLPDPSAQDALLLCCCSQFESEKVIYEVRRFHQSCR